MYIRTYILPAIVGNPYDMKVPDLEEYGEKVTAIYQEIDAGQGEIIGREWLPFLFNTESSPSCQVPALVVRFPGNPTSVGTD